MIVTNSLWVHWLSYHDLKKEVKPKDTARTKPSTSPEPDTFKEEKLIERLQSEWSLSWVLFVQILTWKPFFLNKIIFNWNPQYCILLILVAWKWTLTRTNWPLQKIPPTDSNNPHPPKKRIAKFGTSQQDCPLRFLDWTPVSIVVSDQCNYFRAPQMFHLISI